MLSMLSFLFMKKNALLDFNVTLFLIDSTVMLVLIICNGNYTTVHGRLGAIY